MTATGRHRLEGLEPDNLLAFLALLGLLRALEAMDRKHPTGPAPWRPRAAWDLDSPPLRPLLVLRESATREALCETAAEGVAHLAAAHEFDGQADLNHTRPAARALLRTALTNGRDGRGRADVLAALMSDAAVKEANNAETAPIDPTPFCVLFGQGHQHFLDRFATVPATLAPPARGRGRSAVKLTPADCIAEALFAPWHREDPTFSFRWDPQEDVRYALMAGDPTQAAYKAGTQHGANRLAAAGLPALAVVPQTIGNRVRPVVIGGAWQRARGSDTGFSFAWPVWREPASLAGIRALLCHPDLRTPGALAHLGIDHVRETRRISVGKFMNFSPARPIETGLPGRQGS